MPQKINFKKIKRKSIKFLEILGQHDFLVFLFLFSLSLIIGMIIFYNYSFLVQRKEIKVTEGVFRFKQEDYSTILKIWEERNENFQKAEFLFFLNPFDKIRKESGQFTIEQEKEIESEVFLENFQTAINLYKFYLSREQSLPTIEERARLWEELGLGKASEYRGTVFQNQELLSRLIERFSQ